MFLHRKVTLWCEYSTVHEDKHLVYVISHDFVSQKCVFMSTKYISSKLHLFLITIKTFLFNFK